MSTYVGNTSKYYKRLYHPKYGEEKDPKGTTYVEDDYHGESLKHNFIIRDEGRNNQFFVILHKNFIPPSIGQYWHEVVNGPLPQKIYLDVDFELEKHGFRAKTYEEARDNAEAIINVIYEQIVYVFNGYYAQSDFAFITTQDLFICDSSGFGDFPREVPDPQHPNQTIKTIVRDYKLSKHILVAPHKYAVWNSKENQHFTLDVAKCIEGVNHVYAEAIDLSVHKSTSFLRILGCFKKDSTRRKMFQTFGHQCQDNSQLLTSMVTYVKGLTMLSPKVTNFDFDGKLIKAKPVDLTVLDDDRQKAYELLRKYLGDEELAKFEFRNVTGNSINFNRLTPSKCKICDRVHDADHTLYVIIVRTAGKRMYKKAMLKCRHKPNTAIDIGLIDNVNVEETILTSRSAYNLANNEKLEHSEFEDLQASQMTKYSDKEMHDFENALTLIVRAFMKMGKSKAMIRFLQKYYPTIEKSLQPARIAIITFRQTFAVETYKKLRGEGFVLYSDIDGKIMDDRIIIQVESLHRLEIGGKESQFDLLILDEAESILDQIDSKLSKDFNHMFAIFSWLMKYSKRVIVLDAYIGSRTYNVLKQFRPVSSFHFHWNTYKNATADTYNFTSNLPVLVKRMFASIDAKKNIAIFSNSLNGADILRSVLGRKYPGIKMVYYSSKTSRKLKKDDFSKVDESWSRYQVLLATPTVTAGISFEKEHFHEVYAYFIDRSCTVESSLQMLGRVRNVRDHNYYLYVDSRPKSLLTNVNEILEAAKRRILEVSPEDAFPNCEYTEEGQLIIPESAYRTVWLYNTRSRNLSRNRFYGRLMAYIKDGGSKIEFMDHSGDMKEISQSINYAKEENGYCNAKEIADAPDISDEEEIIINQKLADEQAEPSDIAKLARKKFRRVYGYKGQLTIETLEKYNRRERMAQFTNLTTMLPVKLGTSGDDFIKDMFKRASAELATKNQEIEIAYEHGALAGISDRSMVVDSLQDSERYNLPISIFRHKFIHRYLKAFKFESIFDEQATPLDTITDECLKQPDVQKMVSEIDIEMKEKYGTSDVIDLHSCTTPELMFKKVLCALNKAMRLTYGMCLTHHQNIGTEYYICQNPHFTFNSETNKFEIIPLEHNPELDSRFSEQPRSVSPVIKADIEAALTLSQGIVQEIPIITEPRKQRFSIAIAQALLDDSDEV